MSSKTKEGRQSLGLAALGIFVAATGAALLYISTQIQADGAGSGSNYQYNIRQNTTASVEYNDSSFFDNKPAPSNNAFVGDLTKNIVVNYNYNFSASQPADLTHQLTAVANVKAVYAVKGNSDEAANVWQKTYNLKAGEPQASHTNTVAVTEKITLPFADYKAEAARFKDALILPTQSIAEVVLTLTTTGTASGAPFTDTRITTINVPLEDQVFQPAIKFDKEAAEQVVPESAKQNQAVSNKVKLVAGGVMLAAGIALAAYGLRKRIFKTAYQRELDKIYRYHDGLIVRTSRPIDLADHQIVPMRSFNDMLNLEEELKTPIIADEISSTLTHFLIASHNVMYLYKLSADDRTGSRATPAVTAAPAEPIAKVKAAPAADIPVRTYGLAPALKPAPTTDGMRSTPKRPLGPTVATKKPVSPKLSNDLDDIINELAKKPTKKK